jgi:Lar family restriction alleviation protein
MNDTTLRLERCPFCGAIAVMLKYYSPKAMSDYFYVECSECGATTWKWYDSIDEAASAWNNRVQIDSVQQ